MHSHTFILCSHIFFIRFTYVPSVNVHHKDAVSICFEVKTTEIFKTITIALNLSTKLENAINSLRSSDAIYHR